MRAIAIVIAASACHVSAPYPCMSSDQCVRSDVAGYCEFAGYCSFDDAQCDTHRRFDDSAAAELAGTCVTGIVTGRYRQLYATNDDQFQPVVTARGAPTFVQATLVDGTIVGVDFRPSDGAFSFPDRDGLAYDLLAGGEHYQLASPHVELAERLAGRPDRALVFDPASIRFQYTNNPTGSTVIASTGLWTQTAAGSQSAFTFDWSKATSLSGLLGLLDASQHDVLYFTKTAAQTGYDTITSVATASVTLAAGMTIAIPPETLEPLVLDQCVVVNVPEAQTEARLVAASSRSLSTTASWGISAAPAPDELGATGALAVATGATAALADLVRSVTLHDPFPGTTLLATLELDATFTLAMGGTTGASLRDALVVTAPFRPTGTGTCTDTAMLTSTVGIAGAVTVGGTAVTADDQKLTLDLAHRVPITWTLASAGPVDAHEVQLVELTNDGTSTTATAVTTITTTVPSLALDPARLVKGHTYVLHITELLGLPGAASGDLATLAFPLEQASSWSRSFQVQ